MTNGICSLSNKLNRNFFPIPISDRIKQVFLRAKILGANLARTESNMSKSILSDHLFDMAKYSAEHKKFKRAIRLIKSSLEILKINSIHSHDIYIERTVFLLKCNLDLAIYSCFNKKPKITSSALDDSLRIFEILYKDTEITDLQKRKIEECFNILLRGFLSLTHYYYSKAKSANVQNKLILKIKFLSGQYTAKKKLVRLIEEYEEYPFVDQKLINSSRDLLNEIQIFLRSS